MKYILSILLTLFLAAGCSLDSLFGPDESPGDKRMPREKRDPNPGGDEPAPTLKTVLYLPLVQGTIWTYDVQYKQTAKQSDYVILYQGEEKWLCTQARFSDSTFVFQTSFNGEKLIQSATSTQKFSESSAAVVTAKIFRRALIVSSENGNSISPFFGDWLHLMNSHFIVSFEDDTVSKYQSGSSNEFQYNYSLELTKGLVEGHLVNDSVYDQIKIDYMIKA